MKLLFPLHSFFLFFKLLWSDLKGPAVNGQSLLLQASLYKEWNRSGGEVHEFISHNMLKGFFGPMIPKKFAYSSLNQFIIVFCLWSALYSYGGLSNGNCFWFKSITENSIALVHGIERNVCWCALSLNVGSLPGFCHVNRLSDGFKRCGVNPRALHT